MLQLVTDSSADLPKELLEKYNISVVPLTIELEGKEYLKSEIIKRYNLKDIIINYMGATMGTYAGKGGMIISFY